LIIASISRTILVTVAFVSLLAACGASNDLDFQIYDTRHQANVKILTSDLVRESVKAYKLPGNSPAVYFKLTDQGQSKFRRLTRALAKRGARLHAFQQMAIEINGKVYDRPGVDYKVMPDGFTPDTGLDITLDDLATARRLAKEMRGG
jgi:preprotein translocase subunit SecD